MARLKDFDEVRVLDRAVDCFWKYGYKATTVRDLADAMKIGGLLINSALDVAPHDAEIGKVVPGYLDELRAFFQRNVEAAQRAGQAPRSLDAEEVAGHRLGVLAGIRVLARTGARRKALESVARPALLEQPR